MDRRDFIKSTVSSGLVGATIFAGVTSALGASAPQGKQKKTTKKSLIMYASHTNNTTKVAERFKSTFEINGWQCDIYKIDKDGDPGAIPYTITDYDLVCAGSGINLHSPYPELIAAIRYPRYGFDPAKENMAPSTTPSTGEEKEKMGGKGAPVHGKIVFSPESNKCISFVTFGGLEFGPWEAQPALDWINVEMAHLGIEPVGTFCCPGRFLPHDIPAGYYDDLTTRPNDKDLMRSELFIEQILEAIAYRPPATT